MSSISNTGWLVRSLLRLSPHAFSHHIWLDFVRTGSSFSSYLIEELQQAAKQLIRSNDLENACQIWLICAVLENQRGNNKAALALADKTANLAQNHQLPQIDEWANWGASSLCAQQGDWQQATHYLQRLQQVLNDQGDWMLASVIYILETNLAQLAATEQALTTYQATEPQLAIVLEQFLHWETPMPTLAHTQPLPRGKRTYYWQSLWQALTNLLKRKPSVHLTESRTTIITDMLSTMPAQASAPSPATMPESDAPTTRPVTEDPIQKGEGDQIGERPFIQTAILPPKPPSPLPEIKAKPKQNTPSLTVYCLGSFRVYQDDKPIEQWPSGKGKLIFKYLVTRRHQSTAKEVLMEQFWPDTSPDAARNNLNVAIYGLRQALRNGYENFSHVLFQDDHYLLNQKLKLWVDFEAYLELWQTAQAYEKQGDWPQAHQKYNAAVSIYQGEFLAEDRYEEWILPERQQLQDIYLNILDRLSQYHFQDENYAACIEACRHILVAEPCRESTHRQLMRCYHRQGQPYLGLRQYHHCVEALQNELEVTPSPKTILLYQQIRNHEPV